MQQKKIKSLENSDDKADEKSKNRIETMIIYLGFLKQIYS